MQTKISAAIAAEKIKESITMHDVVARYHHAGRREGRTSCPFHGGEHDNLGYDKNVFHCFVCGAKGDVIDFVRLYHNVDFSGAVDILDRDFSLRLSESDKTDAESAVLRREREKDARRAELARTRKIFVLFTRVMRWIRNREHQTQTHGEMIAFLDRQTDAILSGRHFGSDPKAAARSVVQRVREAEREAICGR